MDTVLVDSEFVGNGAAGNGGGAAFQPSACLRAAVAISGTSFTGNVGAIHDTPLLMPFRAFVFAVMDSWTRNPLFLNLFYGQRLIWAVPSTRSRSTST